MVKSLVVVESPTKARTVKKLLDRKYEVVASMGHVKDLPRSQLGVDVEHEFTPKYVVPVMMLSWTRGRISPSGVSSRSSMNRVTSATSPSRAGS